MRSFYGVNIDTSILRTENALGLSAAPGTRACVARPGALARRADDAHRRPDLAADRRARSVVRVERRRRRDHRRPAVLATWRGKRTLVIQSPHGATHDQLLLQRE